MELRTLQSFVVVAQEENITRAAALLHITQPSLSRQIMQLEDELGTELFHRGKYSVILTEEGRILLRRAQEILEISEKAIQEVRQRENTIAGKISIGCGEVKGIERLTKLMTDFQEIYPDVSFDLYTAIADDVKDRMESGLIDLGLVLEPVDITKYNFLRMPEQERWCALMRSSDPLSDKNCITPEDLKDRRLIVPIRNAVRNELDNWLNASGTPFTAAASRNVSYYNCQWMVESGMGIALCHEFKHPWETLRLLPLKPEMRNANVIIWKKEKICSPAVSKLIEFLRNAI